MSHLFHFRTGWSVPPLSREARLLARVGPGVPAEFGLGNRLERGVWQPRPSPSSQASSRIDRFANAPVFRASLGVGSLNMRQQRYSHQVPQYRPRWSAGQSGRPSVRSQVPGSTGMDASQDFYRRFSLPANPGRGPVYAVSNRVTDWQQHFSTVVGDDGLTDLQRQPIPSTFQAGLRLDRRGRFILPDDPRNAPAPAPSVRRAPRRETVAPVVMRTDTPAARPQPQRNPAPVPPENRPTPEQAQALEKLVSAFRQSETTALSAVTAAEAMPPAAGDGTSAEREAKSKTLNQALQLLIAALSSGRALQNNPHAPADVLARRIALLRQTVTVRERMIALLRVDQRELQEELTKDLADNPSPTPDQLNLRRVKESDLKGMIATLAAMEAQIKIERASLEQMERGAGR